MLWENRRYAIVALLLMVLVLVLGGCGKKKDVTKEGVYSGEVYPENGLPKDEKVTLSMIFPVQGTGKDYFDYAIKTFKERFPNIEINVRYIEGGIAYAQVIQSLLKAADDKEMYDWAHNYGVSKNLLISQGKLEPQDEMWERSLYDRPDTKVKDVVIADKLEVFGPDGHMYIVPQSGSIYGIYFNKKMFKENGWNMQPRNWEEFISLCESIKDKNIYPMVGAGKVPEYFRLCWGVIPYQVGGEKFRKAEYELAPNIYREPAFLMMFKRLEEFAQKGYLHPGTISFDHTQSQMEFLQGQAAMIPVGAWVANEMRDVVPDGFEWGFMALPGTEHEQQQIVLSSSGGNGYIWKNRPKLNKLWAKEFNLWMLNLDIQQKIGEGGAVPVREDIVENKELVRTLSPSVIAAMDYIKEFNVKTINADVRKRLVATPEMAKLPKARQDNIVEVISLKKSAEQAIKEINTLYMRGLESDKNK